MAFIFVLRMVRRFVKLEGLLNKELHPHVYHVYYCAAIVIYLSHIIVSLQHGFETEGTVTASAAALELLAHICGG